MSAHTEGPWRAAISDAGGFQIEIGDTDLTYCVICQRADWSHRAAESIANARLIAAAPDMKRELGRLVSTLENAIPRMQNVHALLARELEMHLPAARAAIEKATKP